MKDYCISFEHRITFYKANAASCDARACAMCSELAHLSLVCGVHWGGHKEPCCLIPKSLLQEGEDRLGKCSAQVFFKNKKPKPAINVTCTRLIEKQKQQQEDYLLYKQMKQLKNPLGIGSIPGMNL
jgi:hypothetical protein